MRWLLSGLGSAVAFLVFLLFDMPVPWALGLGALVYVGLALLLGQGRAAGTLAAGAAGWTEQDVNRALRAGREKVARIRGLRKNVADPTLRGKLERISKLADQILALLKSDPQDIPKARRFLEHYLDATTLIVYRYADLSGRGSSNPDVHRALGAFGALLDTVEQTFQKQYDKLLENDALDLDTEIAVLKKMMELEGV